MSEMIEAEFFQVGLGLFFRNHEGDWFFVEKTSVKRVWGFGIEKVKELDNLYRLKYEGRGETK